MTPWSAKIDEYLSCNCAYGCPCQFSATPTYGSCEAVAGFLITEGHYGKTDLAGVKMAAVFQWPGAIHEGGGSIEAVVDETATGAQRDAILKIMTGQDTEPMATMFAVYTAMSTTIHEPHFAPIDFAINVEERTARLNVPGLIESRGEPIRNVVTGEPHRARIDLPAGFEYELAEMGSGTSRSFGAIKLDLKDSHGHMAKLHLSNAGPVRHTN